ncbi:tellurite resistance protein TerB [Oceanisphaera litoralis]|uniref:tellurite resistance TerB family protein n=1 Tax=Oceanisphaera litoralis TaxID=225144 RepID=UPI00195C81F2|nr:TerB family tellurite resistance protein [Oceanisphaera litoralis]MBM7454519.1 tellurite resistance protein TerB [Oceanisphaera litoralis]
MLGKLFGKKVAAAKAEVKKLENRDLMEALVGGCLLVAYADGELEAAELDNLEKQIAANPALEGFGGEINAILSKFTQMFEAGPLIGQMKVMREIADIKTSKEESEEVFVAMLTIAQADGEVEDAEVAVLKKVGQLLGVNLREFGIE